MRTDFFLHKGAWVHYAVFGNSERGFRARAEEAETAIIDFCKAFIEESLLEDVLEKIDFK